VRRLGAIVAILLGVLVAPLVLSSTTSWLGLLAHGTLGGLCTSLSLADGAAGRPVAARGWGAWFVVATLGIATALHVASWDDGGWAWAPLTVVVVAWAWIPPLVAWLAGAIGARRQRGRSRRAVRRRHAALDRAA
jgi:hypothetical protein